MDQKKELIRHISKSSLPEEVKNDLLERIEKEGATEAIAKEVADLLDLQADAFKAQADIEKERAEVYDELADSLDEADKQQDEALNKLADDTDKELTDLEETIKSKAGSKDANQLKEVQDNLQNTPNA